MKLRRCGLNYGTILAFVYRGWGTPRQPSVSIVHLIWVLDLPNTNDDWQLLDHRINSAAERETIKFTEPSLLRKVKVDQLFKKFTASYETRSFIIVLTVVAGWAVNCEDATQIRQGLSGLPRHRHVSSTYLSVELPVRLKSIYRCEPKSV